MYWKNIKELLKKRWPGYKHVAFIVAGLFWLHPVFAQEPCMLVPAPLSQRIEQATVILEGKVIAQEAFWDTKRQNIYTSNKLEVYKIFKGNISNPALVEVITEGGALDNKIHVFSATLSLQTGQQGIFFLEPSRLTAANEALANRPVYSVYSSQQGFIQYQLPHRGARDPFRTYTSIPNELYPALQAYPQINLRTVKENPDLKKNNPVIITTPHPAARTYGIPAILGFSPDSITAGTGAILTITGSNFGATRGNGFVEFKNSNDGGSSYISPLASDYVLWRDDMIQVKVPSLTEGGTGVAGNGQIRVTNNDPNTVTSTQSLVVNYAFTNVLREGLPYQPYHTNTNQAGGYTLQFAGNVGAAARNAFMRAMQTWSCYTAINWQASGTATVTAPAEDKVNLIRFAPSADLPANVLGRTISRYEGCRLGNSQSYWVSEFDMEFNNTVTWQFGPATATSLQFDFETTALHELGHAHQLAHIIQPRAVMHYSIARGQTTRALSGRNDVDGGSRIISSSFLSNFCGSTRMVPAVATDCNLPPQLTAFVAALQTNGTAQLNWTTSPETGLAYYVVEKSLSGVKWSEIARVTANGQGNYTTTDPQPNQGFTYYRLRLVNTNGQYAYSPVRQTGSENSLTAYIKLYPNPVLDNNLYFDYFTPTGGRLWVTVYDYIGREHAFISRDVSSGNNPFNLDITPLNKGFYILQIVQGKNTKQVKFIKY